MRKLTVLNEAYFSKAQDDSSWEKINLPHTWNNLDGQDGGELYDRGEYRYKIALPNPDANLRQFIQFDGANHIANVYCNGEFIGKHEGGFSSFRFELSDVLKPQDNEIIVLVDNREFDVYPQVADFTFFGGLYREVTFIEANETRFALMQLGTKGMFITPNVSGEVKFNFLLEGAKAGDAVYCEICDASGNSVANGKVEAAEKCELTLNIENPVLWSTKNPYCYTAKACIKQGDEIIDSVCDDFGLRSYNVDVDKGFFLNGEHCALRGVARHQDRLDKGWALSKEDHEEDMELIKDLGANTIRLAHYQHAQYFYDLCDKNGMVVWAEIPFITMFRPGEAAKANTLSQMKELIAQNYNHPSICFWGISNEITIGGENDELLQNLKELNELAKSMDPSRLTTIAHVAMLGKESPQHYITDVLSYNHYFGWYAGEIEDNGPWFDDFHAAHPTRAIGISEYGCEAVLSWHSAKPENHDYTEEYQALYHEGLAKMIAERDYLWATHLWNMFDFAADARSEGGVEGRNNKGLVTFDRKIKKDSYFIYKAYWTSEPFVHISGRRFTDRAPDERNIKIYTNCENVTLFVNGQEIGTKVCVDKMCEFENVNLKDGVNEITAKSAGAKDDVIILNGVKTSNESYKLPAEEDSDAGNWFDTITVDETLVFNDGCFSIKDKMGVILAHPKAGPVLSDILQKSMSGSKQGKSMEKMMGFIQNFTVEEILKFAGKKVPAKAKFYLNDVLNKIEK